MEIVTADFETYYDKDYSLSKMTNESYVRDPRFQVIMLGVRWPDGGKEVITGTHEEIRYRLDQIEWSRYAVLCHNTIFDASILSWHFSVRPAAWLDTLSMARAMHGGRQNSLAALAKRYNLEDKKDTVHNMLGRRRESLAEWEFNQYAEYCLHDVELCHSLFTLMSEGWYDLESMDNRGKFPVKELKLIDKIIRMYTEPVLRLNKDKLQEHYSEVVARKEKLLSFSGYTSEELLSNQKFADVLRSFGVDPPMKVSATTGKMTFAFAKTDPGLKELLEHEDERVQAVVAARLGVKSTLEETRTLRFMEMCDRNPFFPIPLKYGAAKTHRLGGCLVADSEVWVYDPVQGCPLAKRIVDVMPDDLVWDGVEFVPHEGVSFSGFDEVITHDGVSGTDDHRVFTVSGEKTLGEAASLGESIKTADHFSEHHVEAARRLSTGKGTT